MKVAGLCEEWRQWLWDSWPCWNFSTDKNIRATYQNLQFQNLIFYNLVFPCYFSLLLRTFIPCKKYFPFSFEENEDSDSEFLPVLKFQLGQEWSGPSISESELIQHGISLLPLTRTQTLHSKKKNLVFLFLSFNGTSRILWNWLFFYNFNSVKYLSKDSRYHSLNLNFNDHEWISNLEQSISNMNGFEFEKKSFPSKYPFIFHYLERSIPRQNNFYVCS